MKIEFQDITKYFHKPPKLEELQGPTKDMRRELKGEVLLIIPSFHDKRRLSKMFKELSKQNFKKFDIAAIYAKDDKFIKNSRLSIIHVKRKKDLGYAGAVYLGQLFALKYGYKYYLATDVDKYPFSKDSLKLLYSSAEKNKADYVGGRFMFEGVLYQPDHLLKLKKPIFPQWHWEFIWSLIRTSTLLKTGLYPLPLYMGCDEAEFYYRLKKADLKCNVLDNMIFRTYFPHLKLFRLLEKGRVDNTYHYQNLLSVYNMPQIFLSRLQLAAGSLKNKISNFALVLAWYFFAVELVQKLYEFRMPQLKKYRQKARKMRFEIASWEEPCTRIREIEKARKLEPQVAVKLDWPIIKKFLTSIFKTHLQSSESLPLLILIADSCQINDTGKRKTYLLKWKTHLSFQRKILYVCLSAFDGAASLAKAVLKMASGNHIFDGYGMKIARELAEK